MDKYQEARRRAFWSLVRSLIATIIFAVCLYLFLITEAKPVSAEEFQAVEKVSGSIDIRISDFIYPEKGENITGQSLNAFWKYKQYSGLLETNYISDSHSFAIKPSVQFSKGPLSALVGLSTNDTGSDFFQAGIWYADSFGKFKVSVDARNYFGITSQKNGYIDNFVRIMYPITDRFSAGIDFCYDHWWDNDQDWYFIGPRISYQLTERISVYVRPSREWTVKKTAVETLVGSTMVTTTERETTSTDKIRLGLVITF